MHSFTVLISPEAFLESSSEIFFLSGSVTADLGVQLMFRTTFPHCDLRHVAPPFAFLDTAAILPELGTVSFPPASATVLLTTSSFQRL